MRSLHPSPFGLLLQRGSGALEALLHPLEEATAVALSPGTALLWSDDQLPLARRRRGARLAVAADASRPVPQVAAHAPASATLLLLRLQLAPPSGAGPPGAQARRLQLHPLWSASLVRSALNCNKARA